MKTGLPYCIYIFQSYISCGWGIWKVGLVTLPYGVVNTLVSLAGGHLFKYTGRLPIMTLGEICEKLFP